MRVQTDRDAFRETAAGAPTGVRVPVEVQVTVADPFDAYRRARRSGAGEQTTADTMATAARPGGAFLETTGGQAGWGYFAVEPVERLTVGADAAPIDGDRGPTLEAVDGLLEGESLRRGECRVPYPCGAFGWLSYDVARELEDLPETTVDDRGLPRLQLGVYDTVAAWEEPRREAETTLHVTSCPRVGEDVDAAYDRGLERAERLARAATTGEARVDAPTNHGAVARFSRATSRHEYEDRVETVKRYIRDGDTFQANISQRLVAPAAVHPVRAYDALRDVNPAPYSALLEFPGLDLVSASPELLLDVDGDRVRTEPIAGTRPRGETPEADADFAADLSTDEKERAEHAMLVDLERNDLGKVCAYGSVDVAEYRRVDRYSAVMHLVSSVEGRLSDDADLVDAVAATIPGGTITGAPKPRTMAIIDEVETTRRGPYTGAIGVFGFDDRATLNIVIRTLVRTDDEYHLRVGAGIVHDSDPAAEDAETLEKARALIEAVDTALGGAGEMDLAVADGGVGTDGDGRGTDGDGRGTDGDGRGSDGDGRGTDGDGRRGDRS